VREDRLQQIVKLVGPDVLPDSQRLILFIAELFKDGFLTQSAYDEVDSYCTPERQVALLRIILTLYRRARVAIQAARGPKEPGCVYCGMCMYGCPYGYIYSSEQTLPQLKRAGDFRYQPDVIVRTVQEKVDADGRLHDEPTRKVMADQLVALAAWTRKLTQL
jgi:ferredoxin